MSTSARAPAYEEPSPRCGPVLVGTFIGYVAAAFRAGLAALGLLVAEVLGCSRVENVSGQAGILDWPYRGDGAWNALTNAADGLALVLLVAVCVRNAVRARVGADVSIAAAGAAASSRVTCRSCAGPGEVRPRSGSGVRGYSAGTSPFLRR